MRADTPAPPWKGRGGPVPPPVPGLGKDPAVVTTSELEDWGEEQWTDESREQGRLCRPPRAPSPGHGTLRGADSRSRRRRGLVLGSAREEFLKFGILLP